MNWRTYKGFRSVKELILYYKKRGFFRFHFPGGTSENGNINAVTIVVVFDPYGNVLFVMIPYDPNSNLENVVSNKKETPAHLAARKLEFETGLAARTCDFRPVLKVIVADKRVKKSDNKHTKFFYLLDRFTGNIINLDNSSFLNKETATPFLSPGEIVAKEIFHGHLAAFKEAVNMIGSWVKNKNPNLIDKILSFYSLESGKDKDAYVDEYLSKLNNRLYSIKLSIEKRDRYINHRYQINKKKYKAPGPT